MKRGLLFGFVVLFVLLVAGFVSAEKIGIDINNNYVPGENIKFKITLYDDNAKQIPGEISFTMYNYIMEEIIPSGNAKSGDEINYLLPENAIRGLWEISVKYKDIEQVARFNVLELEKADFKIDGDKLIITNIGNVPYGKSIQITIGEQKETILVPLGIGESKTIRLTAPNGNYNVRVNDGTQKEDNIASSGVSLTGNVIGLESLTSKGFWKQYPMVSMFLVALVFVVIVIVGLKIYHRYF